jgi:hypothetical protein
MRRNLPFTLLLAALAFTAAAPVQARLFWQSYGATAAMPDGGCAWNMGTDYFVPRTCDSCRYDLFSACKSHHSISPACRNLHPIYCGYCTPYGACHYKFRDHLYKKRCGCTPLACTYGPWELEKCRKHCRRTPDVTSCGSCSSGCGGCGMTPLVGCADATCVGGAVCDGAFAPRASSEFAYLPNVEPLGGAIIGTVEAYPARMGAAGMGMGAGMPMPMSGAAAAPGMVPGVPQPSSVPGGSGFAYPNF